jgi:hypothetical protein
MTGLEKNLMELVEAVEECLAKERVLPCLVLLYCGIDVVASLEYSRSTRSAFINWVDRYMLKKSSLACTGSDLYGARCGILHEMTARSNLSREGKAREIMYAWGTASPDHLARAFKVLQRDSCAVHVRELVDAFRNGVADYLEEITHNPTRQQKVKARAGLWFTDMKQDDVADFLKQYES